MTASRRFLYGETSRTHWSAVISAHSSTQIVFKSWRFRGHLLWTLIFSYFQRFSIRFKLGDWLGHSNSLIFFLLNQFIVSLAVFWIIVLLKCPPSCHLQHPGGWQQILIKNITIHFSIRPSFNYMKSARCWKTAPHHDAPTSKLHCWCGVFRVMCSAISPPIRLYVMLWQPKSYILVSSDQSIFAQYNIGLSKCCAQTLSKLPHSTSWAVVSCVVSVHRGHGGGVHYYFFFFLNNCTCFFKVFLKISASGSWTTLLIIPLFYYSISCQ